jgi:serine/threonine-protein kinase
MRDEDRVVRVMDFGIAKHHFGDGRGHTVTTSGALMGTPEYMSPEQLRGEATDFRSDLYSFGIVIYELFTGCLPFRGETPVATILRQLQDPPKLDLPRLPPVLRPLLRRALNKKPSGRFRTAKGMGDALRSAHAAPGLTPSGLGALARGEWELPGETRPLEPPPVREQPPVVRIALGLLAVTALAAHLLNAGGVAGATPALPRSEPVGSGDIVLAVPSPESPRPAPAARRVARARAVPTPLPVVPTPSPPPEPAMAEPVMVYAPSRPEVSVEPHRVYEAEEVDVPPRRIQGMTAPYPDWGPELSRGQRVSITASFVVTEEGDVTDIRVERGGGALEAGLVEISSWKYLPGLKDGIPVKVRVHWKHTFIGS